MYVMINDKLIPIKKCKTCGEYFNSAVMIKDKCPICGTYNKDRCKICGKRVKKDDLKEGMCNSCVKNITRCSFCGKLITNKAEIQHSHDSDKLCDKCANEHTKFMVKRYHQSVTLNFYDGNKQINKENFDGFGIELEIDKGGQNNEHSKKIIEMLNDKVYIMRDGSLQEGLEIVTYPNTYDGLMQMNWNKTFRYLLSKGYRSFDTNTCGLHIHVSRTNINNKTLANLIFFTNYFYDTLLKISNRKDVNKARRYCNKYNIRSLEDAKYVVDNYNKINSYSERYRVLNIQRSDTIEFRMLKGTLSPTGFKESITFIKELVDIAKIIRKPEKWDNWFKKFSPQTKYFIKRRIVLYDKQTGKL